MFDIQFDPLTEGYFSYKSSVSRTSYGTLKDMRCTFRRMLDLGGAEKELWRWSHADFIRWVGLARDDGYSSQSLQKQISHARGLLEYAWQNGRLERNVLEGFHLQDGRPRIPPRVLSLEEARRLIHALGRKTARDRRERMIILLLYGCGLRTGEVCRLDGKDVDRERQELFIRQAKGDLQRRIPVPDGVWTELLAYMLDRDNRRGALFVTDTKVKRISQKDVLDAVHSAVERAGLDGGITPKTLRHSFATHLMDRGVDIGIIASLMGHRTPNETGVYLHSLPGRKEAAVEKLGGGV